MRGMFIGEFISLEDEDVVAPVKVEGAEERRKLSLYVKVAHYRSIRRMAADRDLKMQDVVDAALTAYFASQATAEGT